MNILNKIYIIIFTFSLSIYTLFLSFQGNEESTFNLQFKDYFTKLLYFVVGILFLSYIIKICISKLSFKNFKELDLSKKFTPFFIIFVFLLSLSLLYLLFSLESVYFKEDIFYTFIIYIIFCFFESIFARYKKHKTSCFFSYLELLCFCLLPYLITKNLEGITIKPYLLILLPFLFTILLFSNTLVFENKNKKENTKFLICKKKEKYLSLMSIIFILFSIYPFFVSLIAGIYPHFFTKYVVLSPIIILPYYFILKAYFNEKRKIYLFLFSLLPLILIITSFFLVF